MPLAASGKRFALLTFIRTTVKILCVSARVCVCVYLSMLYVYVFFYDSTYIIKTNKDEIYSIIFFLSRRGSRF